MIEIRSIAATAGVSRTFSACSISHAATSASNGRCSNGSRMPVPAPPVQVTASPTEEVLTALYNSEELVYQNQLEQVKAAGGTERDLLTEEEKLELANDETEAIYNTVVYSVYGDEAVYYHATKVCRTQTNGRELTVRDALREGLQPCPNCNPPTVDG